MGRAITTEEIDMRPLAYRVEAAAAAAGFGKSKMWDLIAKGRIRAVRFDGVTLILHSDLEAFLSGLPDDTKAAQSAIK